MFTPGAALAGLCTMIVLPLSLSLYLASALQSSVVYKHTVCYYTVVLVGIQGLIAHSNKIILNQAMLTGCVNLDYNIINSGKII